MASSDSPDQVFLSAVSVFGLWYNAPRPRFIAFAVQYAICSGGYSAVLPTAIAEIYGDENYPSVSGVIYFICGLGTIFGGPIAGVIVGNNGLRGASSGVFQDSELSVLQKRFNDMVVYDGMLLLSAGLCVAYVRWLDARDRGRWSWMA